MRTHLLKVVIEAGVLMQCAHMGWGGVQTRRQHYTTGIRGLALLLTMPQKQARFRALQIATLGGGVTLSIEEPVSWWRDLQRGWAVITTWPDSCPRDE
jgi:hypothetical protein